jgi:oligopeptide/dipeptide ABC transporter ATP-binding protein
MAELQRAPGQQTAQGLASSTGNRGSLLLEVRDLKTHFVLDEGTVRAVDGVSYCLYRGRTLGVVGESGCGKSVTAQSILRIVPRPGRIVSGSIVYYRHARDEHSQVTEEIELTSLDPMGPEIRSIRGNEIAMIFQKPMASLSPVHTIGHQICEVIQLHQKVGKEDARAIAVDMLARVGLPKPGQTIDRYPHQLSGGMRQRAVIAMALSCRPSLLIADEPTTALDVTTEAQILALMKELQAEFGMAIQYITHNLGVIAGMADDVVVMYLGKQVEQANVTDLFFKPRHPYTKALLRSIPRLGRRSRQRLESISGMVPDPYSIPPGCAFHTRCPYYKPGVCEEPAYSEVGPNHWVSCSRAAELDG